MRRHRAVRASPALLRRSGARLLPSLARGLSCWEIGICKKQHRTQMLQLPVQRDETKSGLDLSKIFGGTCSFQKMYVNFLKHIL